MSKHAAQVLLSKSPVKGSHVEDAYIVLPMTTEQARAWLLSVGAKQDGDVFEIDMWHRLYVMEVFEDNMGFIRVEVHRP